MQPEFNFHFSPYPLRGTQDEQAVKTRFTSSDDIYVKLTLPYSIEQYLWVTEESSDKGYFLDYSISISKDGKPKGKPNLWTSLQLSEEEIKNYYLIVDVLTDAFNASNRIFQLRDLTLGFNSFRLSRMITNKRFSTEGVYTVIVKISNKSIVYLTSIDFSFTLKDIQLIQHKTAAVEASVKDRIQMYVKASTTGLPFEWNMKNSASVTGFNEQELKAKVQDKLGIDGNVVNFIIQPTIHI